MARFLEFVRRSFQEFLATPTIVIIGFVALGGLMYWVDRSQLPVMSGIGEAMSRLLLATPDATRSLLGTLAGSLVTLTSITFSLLLIALQQAAASMTHAIVDQFLRRTSNQVFFGFFIGLALYALMILSATAPDFNPVISASLALLLGAVSLFLLILLIYSTIHQVRPAVVVEAIHDLTLTARDREVMLLGRTRRASERRDPPTSVVTEEDGFVVNLDLDRIARALEPHPQAEAVVRAPIGAFVSYGDVLIDLRGATIDDDRRRSIRAAFVLDRVRDVSNDPGFGIEELVNIGWTSISTSKQNPAPGHLVILAIRDLLARCAAEMDGGASSPDDEPLPIVYPDRYVEEGFDALELLAVVCSESMQAQNATAVVDTLTLLYPRFRPETRSRIADASMRLLAGLGDHVMTASLEEALRKLARALGSSHRTEALAIGNAVDQLARSNGRLNSRSTRVQAG